jgi:DNA-binding ferritin-like protein
MEKPRLLKRDAAPSASYSRTPAGASIDTMTAACATELMNAASSFHKLHLKVKGSGAYAAHKALNDLYDALPGHADTLIEGYQGAAEKILDYKEVAPRTLNTVEEGLSYLRDMYEMVNGLQAKMPYSEIVNSLDTLKDSINSAKYKLLFLK